ncbi:ribosomal protein S18 acetylase RimI-like enzyme [Stackebrandtia endophytica]|uniref:Ribosomal protein S18 acetylase RimI-like enzyme n=1 Tax=Stackebrandtia endophytica TaxID=1496996 RepID=A0A543ASG6_9ACTN|nr:GNAT family N-acetyltransferase [Stackebrandtia endophytica]TQL75455.1 ribosomal protein S18 acetylase RimI-like enzyme [Stackebrandtia endophytica]
MTAVRRADERDHEEIVRLRSLMYDSMNQSDAPASDWREAASRLLRVELASPEPHLVVYVIDGTDGLAACATGFREQRLPSPTNPSGLMGHISNVYTDHGYRRRGHARACTVALLEWFADQGVTRVNLRASAEAEPLYRSLGFERTGDPAMRLNLAP